MRNYLNKLTRDIRNLIHLSGDVANSNNMSVYLVGGCVRDLILGIKNLDLDMVVEGDGIKFAEDLAGILRAKTIRHRRFGTATIVIKPNLKVDIATARRERYPHPASLPIVSNGNLREDLARRDFTINAMAISLDVNNPRSLIDLFGSRNDLKQKKIRVLHNLSFIDDPTRVLRAIRFEKRYDFKIEPKTLAYLKAAVGQKMLEQVQPQRLRDELILMLKEEQPLKQIKRVQALTGFIFVSPRLCVSKDTYKLYGCIERQITWFKKEFPRHRQIDTWLIYFMGLIDSLNTNEVRSICKKFVFRKGEEKRIFTIKKIGFKFCRTLSRDTIRSSKIFHLLEPLSYEAIIFIKAKYSNSNVQKHVEQFLKIYNGMHIRISGDDLHRLGITPGPNYQKIFCKVLNALLDGLVSSKEEELLLIKKIIKNR
jgi:tRNA nucleotidyltransferase (CCA-adding enzyme)